jgi:hypothetical protein
VEVDCILITWWRIVDKILPANRRCAFIGRITITEYRIQISNF